MTCLDGDLPEVFPTYSEGTRETRASLTSDPLPQAETLRQVIPLAPELLIAGEAECPLVEGHKDRYLTTLQVRQESPVSIAQPGLVGDEG